MKSNVKLSILLVVLVSVIVAAATLFLCENMQLSKETVQYQVLVEEYELLYQKDGVTIDKLEEELRKLAEEELEKLAEEKANRLVEIVKEPVVIKEVVPTLSEVVKEVIDGVVHIKCPQWQGSGFVIGPRLIKTARHVAKGVTDFTITTNDGHVIKATRAISPKGYDTSFVYIDDLTCVGKCEYENDSNITVLRGEHEVKLKVLELGSIKDCVLGQKIFLIGSPLGDVHFNALTVGYISKLDTKLEDFGMPKNYGWATITTVDAVALGGNSGCPVFDMSGSVIGILVGGKSDALNWIVPVDVFADDVAVVMQMFVQDKYQLEKAKDNRFDNMYNWYRWQRDDRRLDEVHYWFLEQESVIENLVLMVENLTQSVTLIEYMNARE